MAKNEKINNEISFTINKTVYVIDFDNISWMYVGVYSGDGKYGYSTIKYMLNNNKDSSIIKFKTEEQANLIVKMFEDYCKLKYNYCDELCVI